MKKVFTNASDVIHLFAQRSQCEARCNNVFFKEDKIYSYGYHYLLAEFIKNEKGDEAIMINDNGYSNTTAKHISQVRSATRQYKQFFTTETDPRYVLLGLEQLAHGLQNARKPEKYILPAEQLFTKYQEFILWKGEINDVVTNATINKLITTFRGESYSDYLKEKSAIIKLAQERKIEEEKKRKKKQLKDFFVYKTYSVYGLEEDFCRISRNKEFVETTQNVKVSVKCAKVLYQMIKEGKDIKGFDLCGYTVIGLNGVLRIGCHKIDKNNMKKIGKILLTM